MVRLGCVAGIAAVVLACGVSAAAAAVELAPDESLLPASYAKYGLPDVSQPWDSDEHAMAASLIERVARDQPLRLPRLDSPRSGPIFARLVAPSNLDGILDSNTSLMARAELLRRFSDTTRRVIDAYASAEEKTGQLYFDEQLALQQYMLRTLLAGDDMVAEVIDALPPGSVSGDTMGATQAKLRKTMAASVASLMDVLRISRYSFNDQRVRAMRELQVLLPLLYDRLPADAQTDLKARLEEMRENEFDPMWRVCATTLEDLAAVEDPRRESKPRVIGSREADRKIIRRSP